MSTTQRNFEFISYENSQPGGTSNSMRKIHSHVMHDWVWRQEESDLRGSVRPYHGDSSAQRLCLESPSDAPAGKGQGVVQYSRRLSRRKSRTTIQLREVSELDDEPPPNLPQAEHLNSTLDPFDSLPVKNIPELKETLHWYFAESATAHQPPPSWLQQLNITWQESLWEMAKADAGVLHALLSIAETRKMTLVGHMDTTKYHYHIGRVLEIIQATLSVAPLCYEQCENTVMLITTQTSRAIGDGDYTTARVHMQALLSLLINEVPSMILDEVLPTATCSLRRSNLTLTGVPFIHTTVNDLRLAAMTCQGTMIPMQIFRSPKYIPRRLVKEAHYRSLATLAFFPSGLESTRLHNIVRDVHKLSLLLDKEYAHDVDLEYAFHIAYGTQYRICDLAAISCRNASQASFNGAPIQPTDAVIFTMTMFTRTCLPSDLPKNMQRPSISCSIQVTLMRRVMDGLYPAVNLLEFWLDTGASLECLLWIMFHGTATSLESSLGYELDWFYNGLRNVVESLGIGNRNDFERALKMFPWTQQTFDRQLVSVGDLLKLDSADGVSMALICSADAAASNFEAFIY